MDSTLFWAGGGGGPGNRLGTLLCVCVCVCVCVHLLGGLGYLTQMELVYLLALSELEGLPGNGF
jgi:hypothetical protein